MSKYPFTAIVGQEAMKSALILNAIDPSIGGVLIRGHKGTAKSTAVRSLADLLLPIKVIDGCPYHCNPDSIEFVHDDCRKKVESGDKIAVSEYHVPLIELPLGATEDRLVGSLHLERAIHDGQRVFEPGLLAKSNRGILYVDEVNLLDDHLVDLLLDTAASGINRVEREGLSVVHPAAFMLVGTMNPEEGELRPQFLDRFGLCIGVTGEDDISLRSEVIRRRLEFERNPVGFCIKWEKAQNVLKKQIALARENLSKVSVADEVFNTASKLAIKVGAQGHRAEITIIKVAVALAAFQERNCVNSIDVIEAAAMALPHRLDRFVEHAGKELPEELKRAFIDVFGETPFVRECEEEDDEDMYPAFSMEEDEFPGSFACGAPIFSFLKKKLPKLFF